MVTIHDVAAHAGVSAMTVSRVLNGSQKVAPATRQRIEKAIEELGYFPNALARGLLSGRTQTIGVLVGDITNPYWTAVASGAEEVVHRNGYTMVLGNTGSSQDKADQLIQTLVSNRVDGLLINDSPRKTLKTLIKRDYPIVLINKEYPGIHADTITGDNFYGASVLTQHLLDLGHTRIALLNGPIDDSEAIERERGFRKTLQDAGVEANGAWILNASYHRHSGYQPAKMLLTLPPDDRPTAIVASNNFIALSVIEAARDVEVRIPEELALVGFDDFELASTIYPFLTVIAQPARVYGMQAAQMLIDHLNSPGHWQISRRVFTPELIVRISCGSKLRR
ncbi:MAG: LacI family DNA-binding transcriptional regulator [Anaerolinea sp.]|nr:LacI family DNA-binding transcriptional regulator [Anaerolinea sp.]